MDVFCKSRGELTKHFLALKNYRNSIKNNRDREQASTSRNSTLPHV